MNDVDVDFACTQCAKCCHDLRLPLTIDEAIDWLSRGGTVELLSEAMPWLGEPPPENTGAAHKRRRSFAASSGELPVRVAVIVAAAFSGPCPNLLPDKRCGIYPERPLVCRIYPAEINPSVKFEPRHKACPPDAWANGSSALVRAGRLVDAVTMELIERSRQIDAVEVAAKAHLCRALGIDRAAISNEGFVVHSPDAGSLLNALQAAKYSVPENHSVSAQPESSHGDWRLVSNRRASVAALAAVAAHGEFVGDEPNSSFRYLSFGDSAA
ncbi:YkgJ family cysteine cluster protein [Trinickia dabaoshanensis]|uniref:YkgJ family cysteine cluster protein n=1 Tax=Trinickia dabaoshanensis TaxID=564714 RepID=UPI001E344DAF|nr:YkgJ family cysteine cluster protein [Trinickia dabaoshanensis]